jgi:hypothetical protein
MNKSYTKKLSKFSNSKKSSKFDYAKKLSKFGNSKIKKSSKKYLEETLSLVPSSIRKSDVSKTSYKGTGEDLFFSFIYLKKKFKNFYIPIGDFTENHIMWNVLTSWKCISKINDKIFEIHLPMPKNKFISEIQNIFLKREDIDFILLPIYLGSSDCRIDKGHMNIAIVDILNLTYERFEPYGKSANLTIHRHFNKKIVSIFKEAGFDLEIIENQLPHFSFQEIEEREVERSIASLRNSDPGGFCGVWSIWYVELFLKNTNLNRKELIKKAIRQIKDEQHFRNFIRNYSQHLVKYRKKLLKDISEKCRGSLVSYDYSFCTRKYIEKNLKKI